MFEDRPKPVVLMILDGWGTAPAAKANAIEYQNYNESGNIAIRI